VIDPSEVIIYLRVTELPTDLRDNPELLTRWFEQGDAGQLRAAVQKGEGEYRLKQLPPSGPDELIAALQAGDTAKAGSLISRDPVNARRQIDAHRQESLDRVSRYLDETNYAEAVWELESLVQISGRDSEVLARLGVAEILRGRAESAAQVLNDPELTRPRGAEVLLDEINRRLGQKLPEAVRQDLIRVAKVADFRDAQAKGKTGAGSGEMALTSDEQHRLRLEYRMQEPVPKPQRHIGPFDQANRPLVYYDSDPEIAKQDWSAPGQQRVMQGLIPASVADLFLMHDPVVGHSEPDALVIDKGNASGRYLQALPADAKVNTYRRWDSGDDNYQKRDIVLVKKKG
jgi:hypothetical protein